METMEDHREIDDLELNTLYDLVSARSAVVSEIGDGQGNDRIHFAEIFTMASTLAEESTEENEDNLSDTQIPLVIKQPKRSWFPFPCIRNNNTWSNTKEQAEGLVNADEKYTKPCNFFRCPAEVRIRIFSFLTQTELIKSRGVCTTWKKEIDSEVLCVTTSLNHLKVKKYMKLAKKKHFKIHVAHYDLLDLVQSLKRKHFKCLPEPRSLNITGSISPKNFRRLVTTWRNIRSISFGAESLNIDFLFWFWKIKCPLEYFPRLERMEIVIDRMQMEAIEFVPRTLRYNLDSLLLNPYENVVFFKYHMVNLGHHYPCAFLAPILMFIGRNHKSLKEIDLIFHTGVEIEGHTISTSHLHAPLNFSPVLDELYVHGESNLAKLKDCRLDKIKLHIPSIDGCRTKSGICNYFKTIIQAQNHLRELILETDSGISVEFLTDVLNRKDNSRTLAVLEVTLQEQDFVQRNRRRTREIIKPLDLALFSSCVSLKSLRLKRIGMTESALPISPHIHGAENLPVTLEKLFLSKLNFLWEDLHGIVKSLPNLQCLFIDRCDIQGNVWKTEELISRTLIDVCFHNSLKFFSLSPARRNSLHEVCLRLSLGEETAFALTKLGWRWFLIVREFGSSHFRRIIFHKGKEYCKHVWFETYVFERNRY